MKNKIELITKILKSNSDGLTIAEISDKLKISRITAAVALAELKGANLIRIRSVGITNLNYWKTNTS